MTQVERDRDRLSKYAANPTPRSHVLVFLGVATLMVVLAMAVSFKGQSGGAVPASLMSIAATIVAIRYLMIDPLIREVRRLSDELESVKQQRGPVS